MDPTLALLRIASTEDLKRPCRLRDAVREMLRLGRCNVVLVLHHEGTIEYGDIRVLGAIQRLVRSSGGVLSIVVMREDLRLAFRRWGVAKRFNLIDRVEGIPRLEGACRGRAGERGTGS